MPLDPHRTPLPKEPDSLATEESERSKLPSRILITVFLVFLILLAIQKATPGEFISTEIVWSKAIINKDGEILNDEPVDFYGNGLVSTHGVRPAKDLELDYWGYLSNDGSWLVDPIFWSTDWPYAPFDDGEIYAWVDDGTWSLIKLGKPQVAELRLGFDEVMPFDPLSSLAPAKNDNKWGLIDRNGNWTVEPSFLLLSWFEYDLEEQASLCALDETTERWGRIDLQGNWIIEPKFDSSFSFTENGTAFTRDPENNLYGIINTQGDWIAEPVFSDLAYFRYTPMAPFKDSNSGLYGGIDNYGNWVIEPKYDYISNPFKYANGKRYIIAEVDGLRGVMDEHEQWIIEPKYLTIDPLQSGELFAAQDVQTKLYGILDPEQEWVVEPTLTGLITSFGYIDTPISDPDYLPAQNESGLWGYIDFSGNWVIEPQFLYANMFDDEGTAVVECEYEKLRIFTYEHITYPHNT